MIEISKERGILVMNVFSLEFLWDHGYPVGNCIIQFRSFGKSFGGNQFNSPHAV